ncbi:FMN-linked oxidoreductase [Epithele typhae]|uniref:FMN-linked oxidoreductase n=1 Tax=Epithele typhae TaxID=378194 RepID=UPI0020087971|nr:FMN-linked oxidoreductase [Epithele typhae]KAH9934584.1 FMN-linked oxidoreductase [Epithele typhae]
MPPTYEIAPAPGASFFTHVQVPVAGTAPASVQKKALPKLFQPIKIRGVEFQNRLQVSPMVMMSATADGAMTPFNSAMLGAKFIHGPGLTFTEGTLISPESRSTPHDLGLWSDAHIAGFRSVVDLAHSQGQKLGVQLGHCGRKSSQTPLWHAAHELIPPARGGWTDDFVAPSALAYDPGHGEAGAVPHALTVPEIKEVVRTWAAAARRAVAAGVDVVEVHAAHGFLLHSFMSPVANARTDEYGGSFENRVRLLLEVVDAIRAVIPEAMPLFVRVSATDWLEKVLPEEMSWTIEDTVRLAKLLSDHGVDVLDVSSGGMDHRQKIEVVSAAYQAHFSEAVKKAVGDRLFVTAVGGIRDGHIAEDVLEKGQADAAMVGTASLKNPAFVLEFAEQLGVEVKPPHQVDWVLYGRGSMWRWKD